MISTLKNLLRSETRELPNSGVYTFLNPYSYLVFRRNKELYKGFDGIYFDGILLCKIMRLVGVRSERVSFDMTSLAPKVFEWAEKESESIYFIGSDSESIEGFCREIKKNYPALRVVGFRDGYFKSQKELDNSVSDIIELMPDVVLVGMGAPLQEQYLMRLKEGGWKGVGYTCGGFIHQTSSKGVAYYPGFFNYFNLRWLYRIYDEPKLFSRYAIKYPQFLVLFFFDLVSFKASRRKDGR